MELDVVRIDKPDDMNVIVGQAHFIKTIEDVHEALAESAPSCASVWRSVRHPARASYADPATTQRLVDLATQNALAVGAGHSFLVFLEDGYPVNVLNALKHVPEVCGIFCATANPVELIVGRSELGRGIVGVIDGLVPRGIETEADVADRKQLLRTIGYKL